MIRKPPSRKGVKLTDIHKEKIGLANKRALKGKKIPERVKKKMSETHKRIGTGKWMKGRKLSKETKEKMSKYWTGRKKKEKCLTSEEHKLRMTKRYKEWRMKVFLRDNFTCQFCEKRGGRLEAHHIKSFADYPRLRFDVNNGITFCFDCHKLAHKVKK